ncbi:MAG: bifunctional (p)ppGpp synthetase/guanosine-3',5'-bis(diphosphate) 3'-pyrophosphohydrolase [Bacilli bacterium]|nr:bifunctional (p)ppGpp synthetase/guanosine-3',5'-bis(diphosphate) 3'-pyrophosphohydrolase [Bacilli bacterium]
MNNVKTIEDIIEIAKEYLHEENIEFIKKAYAIAEKMHEGQFRKSGERYVHHPIEVAYILTELHSGPSTIAASLVHDVLEDTGMSKEEMIAELGEDVTNIVDGVTKISKLKYHTKDKVLAQNHQKILLAMAKDIRVVLVKLVDRLHNMRTLQFHDNVEKQKRISKETLDLYAPLAHRLGMYRIKAELEDLSLKYLYPENYYEISNRLKEKKSEREDDILLMQNNIEQHLKENNVTGYEIKGRIKNIYSIYKKVVTKNKTLDDIYDFLALRVIVNTVEDCYRVLGIIHGRWTPLPMRFKDYIAVPKTNLYQSLHTTIVGENGKIFEIQIRTYDMDRTAEIGVAAHWAYKENAGYSPEKEQLEITNKLKWYKNLSTYVDVSGDIDPLDNIIEDIFSANVYIFTPNGDVIDLPSGSMPLDFAYRIHTHIGNTTVGAIVNGKIVPLSYKLKTGDVVAIKTNKNVTPTKEWLKHAKTSGARQKINSFINKQKRDELITQGSAEFEKYAKTTTYNPNQLDDEAVKKHFGKNNINTVEDLMYDIGRGYLTPQTILNRLLGITDVKLTDELALKQYGEDNQKVKKRKTTNAYGIIVEGLEKAQLRLGNCCQPVYGDNIYGYITKGSGIVVHREGCPNITKSEDERYIKINWDPEFQGRVFDTTLKISAIDKKNILADFVNSINSTKATIVSVSSTKNKSGECVTKFKLQVANLDDLNHVILSIGKISEVYGIERVYK